MKILAFLFCSALAFGQVRYGDQVTSVTQLLTVTVTGTGTGSVSSMETPTPFINNCTSAGGANCSYAYATGVAVALVPTATGGSGFSWSSGTGGAIGCSGSGSCIFSMTAPSTVTGIFSGSSGSVIQPSPTFSIDMNPCNTFPSINMGQIRFWDTSGCQWSFIETAANVFNFTQLDAMLLLAAQNSVHTAQFGLARTPSFASSNTNLTVTTASTTGTGSSGETLTQAGVTYSTPPTFVSYASGTLTISNYVGTASGTIPFVGSVSGATFTPASTCGAGGNQPCVPAGCAYFTNGSANPGLLSGQCYPPTDINADGTGTDATWIGWIAAIVSHVNQSGYLAGTGAWAAGGANCPGATNCPHASIPYWETWNEPFATGKFWSGSYDQLIRFEQDAACLINGGSFTVVKGPPGQTTCPEVQASVTNLAGVAGLTICPNVTSFSGSSGTLTFQATNTLTSGAQCYLSGFTSPNGSLNGQIVTVSPTGLTSSQFEAPVVGSGYSSGSSNGGLSQTAQVIMPSYQPSGIALMQCFLYCTPQIGLTGTCGAPATSCTSGSAGANQTAAINFHAKPGPSLETGIPVEIAAINGILQSAELAKPQYDTEAGFSTTGWLDDGAGNSPDTEDYLIADMQAGYICRMYADYYANGVTNIVWYNYSVSGGGLGQPLANSAYSVCYNWMVGSTPGTLTHSGSVYTYTLTLANGTAAALIWDKSQYCTAANTCTSSTQTVNSAYLSYLDLYGNPKVSIPQSGGSAHQMQVYLLPRLAQAQ
jgi:hypothetical protein